MTFSKLTQDEQRLLGALIRLMVRADGQFSHEEEAMITRIGGELAAEDGTPDPTGASLWRAISESAQHFPSDPAIRAAIPTVTRAEARELIFAVLTGVASAETISPEERTILDALRLVWALKE